MRMIIAVDQDNAIGWADGRLPWRSTQDMKRFKELTAAGDDPSVIMGRKTWDSLPSKFRPLPHRNNLVLTIASAVDVIAQRGTPVASLEEACKLAGPFGWIIGGAHIYNQALAQGLVTELYITRVELSTGADVKLAYNLYDITGFIQHEKLNGRTWVLGSISVPLAAVEGEPDVSFIHLKLQA